MKNKNGFTLVEVLVTITILGIVTLISLPVISAISGKLNDNKLDTYKGIIESGRTDVLIFTIRLWFLRKLLMN